MKTNKLFMRLTLVLILLLGFAPPIGAFERPEFNIRIHLTLVDIQPNPLHPRTPIEVPEVGQTDHTLFFLDETALVLNIYSVDNEGDETLEYTTEVSATTTSVQLPSDLTGTYIIEIVCDGLCFRGDIEL